MTLDPTPRDDLVNPGVFVPTKVAAPARSRAVPTLLTEGSLDAPKAVDAAIHYDDRGRPVADPKAAVARVEGGRRLALAATAGGQLYDPNNLFEREGAARLTDPRTGRGRYEYAPLPEAAFADYLTYLQTRNRAFLFRAERAKLNHG